MPAALLPSYCLVHDNNTEQSADSSEALPDGSSVPLPEYELPAYMTFFIGLPVAHIDQYHILFLFQQFLQIAPLIRYHMISLSILFFTISYTKSGMLVIAAQFPMTYKKRTGYISLYTLFFPVILPMTFLSQFFLTNACGCSLTKERLYLWLLF